MSRRGTTTQRGYGNTHQRTKDTHRPIVDAGMGWCNEVICLHDTRWINPQEPWDLAHDRVNGGYLGPAHRRCNRSEGARYGNTRRGQSTRSTYPVSWHSTNW